MDPDEALATLRKITNKVQTDEAFSMFAELEQWGNLAMQFSEAFDALDGWLAKGGFLPTAWAVGHRGRDERTLYRWTVADADAVIGREITDDEIDRIEKAMDNSSAGESFETVVSMICDSE